MFVNHIFARDAALPAFGNFMYEYVVGENGVFVRAKRPGLHAMIPVMASRAEVRGLVPLIAHVWVRQKIQAHQVRWLFDQAYFSGKREVLFYGDEDGSGWEIIRPEQEASATRVRPVDAFAGVGAMLEVHSHHKMDAFFSDQDNREEGTGFRLYAVIGGLPRRPTLRARVGIYGHFMEFPAGWVFDLPGWVIDGVTEDAQWN